MTESEYDRIEEWLTNLYRERMIVRLGQQQREHRREELVLVGLGMVALCWFTWHLKDVWLTPFCQWIGLS